MGKTFHAAQRDMAQKVRRLDEEVRQLAQREQRKVENLSVPVELWLSSGTADGGVLIVHHDEPLRTWIADRLIGQGYRARAVETGRLALSALRAASYTVMVVHWGTFRKADELVNLLRKAFPRTRYIIVSPRFAWPTENAEAGQQGLDVLEAGAYAYMPEQDMRRNIISCVEAALASKERACPVLLSGRACNQQCVI